MQLFIKQFNIKNELSLVNSEQLIKPVLKKAIIKCKAIIQQKEKANG